MNTGPMEMSRGRLDGTGISKSISDQEENRMVTFAMPSSAPVAEAFRPRLPDYLTNNYWWAYLCPASVRVFDHTAVVSAILWGNYNRLKLAALGAIGPGQRVLQAACVYGDLSPDLARRVGPSGRVEVIDIVPLQVANCRRKLELFPNTSVRLADAATFSGGPYDTVVCFFLLHELPDDLKRSVVDRLLGSVVTGGRVIFVDYHRPRPLHPLKPITNFVFKTLEPYAKTLWRRDIDEFATDSSSFVWRKQLYFGGLFQKVVAERFDQREKNEQLASAGRRA